MAKAPIPPALEPLIRNFQRVGYKVISAGLAKALEEVGLFTGEVDARVKRGARKAQRMANGEPFDPDGQEECDDD